MILINALTQIAFAAFRGSEFVFQSHNLNGPKVRLELENLVTKIESSLALLREAAVGFNAGLPEQLRAAIAERKSRILDRRGLVESIGLPLAKRQDQSTYSIPAVRRKPQVTMPTITNKAFAPEPALAQSEYEAILRILHNMVRVMENSPQHFRQTSEEALRSHFLVQLNGHYEGRATGETFNYEGKTDILIKERERNVFIAECKFWKGKESLTRTIDQVLGSFIGATQRPPSWF